MWKKHKFWVILFSLLFLSALASLLLLPRLGKGHVARITSEGKVIKEIDLDLVSEPYEFTVETSNGYNRIRVEKGKIAVIEADCPDKVCQKTGWISGSLQPILCLPHELVIEILGEGSEADVIAGGVS